MRKVSAHYHRRPAALNTIVPVNPETLRWAGGLAFILIWSSGYIGAVWALQGSGVFTLASIRFVITALLIGAWVAMIRPVWPSRRAIWRVCLSGLLLQGGFFGFIYAAMRAGVPPATAGLIAGLMPLCTAAFAALLLSERMSRAAMFGLVLGLGGVLLVVVPELEGNGTGLGYLFAALALLSLSLGTVAQKAQASAMDARLALVIQVSASALVMLPFAAWLEGFALELSPIVLVGMTWIILANSCFGLLLYLWLLRSGGAGQVANLFFLVPPVTAVMTALLLGAEFSARDALGFALAAAGVWLGQRGKA